MREGSGMGEEKERETGLRELLVGLRQRARDLPSAMEDREWRWWLYALSDEKESQRSRRHGHPHG